MKFSDSNLTQEPTPTGLCPRPNDGGKCRNPVGVESSFDKLPRVARASRLRFATTRHAQPWAGGCSPFGAGRGTRSGVALVITLIFLAVITFMAVTFLVVARRERERAITQTTQSDAKFANDVAFEHFKAWFVASTLGRNNSYDIGLFVSTNYINPLGFDPTRFPNDIINVSYTYVGGGQVAAKDMPKLVSNLRILPRVPVFVSTNRNAAFPPDFRFYLDLNRNGVYDTNGNGTNYVLGQYLRNPDNSFQTNSFVGDPEWIGILNNPEQCSSASNQFIARYAFIAIPIGNTLDLNYIHNQAKQPKPRSLTDGFMRNEGFGSWELNLAGFFRYLNTNGIWTYNYANANPPLNTNAINSFSSSIGTAFDDAASFVLYRYTITPPNGNWQNLAKFRSLYGVPGVLAYPFDYIDVYSHGPIWVNAHSPTISGYPAQSLFNSPWSGADNPTHFFSTQDLWTYTNQLPNNFFLGQVSGKSNFVDRMNALSSHTNNSDDRYTFYKLLAQAGFESAPETNNKINLNYASVGGTNSSMYIGWTATNFFTNAATKLLQTLGPPYPANLSTAFIPVWPTNISLYDSAVHRMLQVAANIYDATTNRPIAITTNGPNPRYYPSVFRPTFGRTNLPYNLTAGTTNINVVYISGYEEVPKLSSPNDLYWLAKPLSLPEDINQLPNNSTNIHANIYGVPWIIGAKKGLPSFNQFVSQTTSHVTRRLDIDKRAGPTTRSSWKTNQMYIIGVSNLIGLDAWNSYAAAYPSSVAMIANDDLRMSFSVYNNTNFSIYNTNNPPPVYTTTLAALQPLGVNQSYFAPATNMAVGTWTGFNGANNFSFLSYRSNIVFLPDMQYQVGTRTLVPANSTLAQFEPLATGPLPHFVVSVTNRLRMVLVDTSEMRVLDYVQFGGADVSSMDTTRDLTAELAQNDPHQLWNQGSTRGVPNGPNYQLQISLGNIGVSTVDWNNAQIHSSTDQSKSDAIAGFNSWYNGGSGAATNLVMQAPFTPTAEYSQTWSWQANDPLVHYTTKDLNSPANTGRSLSMVPPDSVAATSSNYLATGTVTSRYHPWNYAQNSSTDPGLTDLTLKDPVPGVGSSDAWDFPTNKFANIGWLGRVHRGTPWQTIYLKAQTNTVAKWQSWTLNSNLVSAIATQPTNDWKILDLFTVAPNDNATRGRLSINQSGMAAWAAVLQGVVTLTNTPSAGLPYSPLVIDPNLHDAQFQYIVNGINQKRATYPGGVFTNLGDILSVPQLTTASPFINTSQSGIQSVSDAVYERLPEQILSLLKVGEARYLVYCYGQSLKPADHSVFQGAGPLFGIVTNYQVTGEVVTRAVVRITDQTRARPTLGPNAPLGPNPSPQIIVESFNALGPDQ
jgi:hypothetical protein